MQPNYLSTDADRRTAIAAIKFARSIAETPPMRGYAIEEYKPGRETQSDEAILEFARNNGATIFHPSGTCKMGQDASSVVDARLRVHGISGLRVADCSIMPTLVSGNTHAGVVMIAEKAADMIIEDARNN